MKRLFFLFVILVLGTIGDLSAARDSVNPYANDLGPDTLDVSAYPADVRRGYEVLQSKCSRCHTVARPLNSQFVEPMLNRQEQKKWVAQLRRDQPDLFSDRRLLRIEERIWDRYIHRMMNKPACAMNDADGRAIHLFLKYDGVERKLKNPATWVAHRRALLNAFEQKFPERYQRLYRKK